MKLFVISIVIIHVSLISVVGQAPNSNRVLDQIIDLHEREFYSQGRLPGWTGVVSIYSGYLRVPEKRGEILEYVKEKVLKEADSWPEVVPLYLQIGGDPKLIVKLLPTFKNPKTVALAKVYMMVHGVPSGQLSEPIKNSSNCLETTLRLEKDILIVSVENIDRHRPVLFVRGTAANLSVQRMDGIDLPAYRTPRRGPLNQKSIIVLNPGDKYEFKVQCALIEGVIPAVNCYIDKGNWYIPGLSMGRKNLTFWGLDDTVVASEFDQDPVPLMVQYIYDPSIEIRRIDPSILGQYLSSPEGFNGVAESLLLTNNVGIVASNPMSIKLAVPRPAKGSAISIWHIPWLKDLIRDETTGEWTREGGSARSDSMP